MVRSELLVKPDKTILSLGYLSVRSVFVSVSAESSISWNSGSGVVDLELSRIEDESRWLALETALFPPFRPFASIAWCKFDVGMID